MYLHLGKDFVAAERDIIGIFDLDTTTYKKKTREFLASCEKKGLVTNISDELPKSFILCADENGVNVYVSQISSSTLKRRALQKPIPDSLI